MADQRKAPPTGANSGSTNPSTTPDKSASPGAQGAGAQGAGAQPTGPQSWPTPSGSMMDGAKGTAVHLADQVQQKASTRLHSTLDQGKTRAADALGSAARTLLNSTQQLRDQSKQGAGQGGAEGAVTGAEQGASEYVERAAHQMQQLSDYLRNSDVNQIVHRVEQTARTQPALFIGGAFTIGLIGARFLKSSHRDIQQQNDKNMNPSNRLAAASGSMYGGTSQDRGMHGDRDVTAQRGVTVETPRTGGAGSTGATAPAGSTGSMGSNAASGTAGSSASASSGQSGQQRNTGLGESSSGTGGTGNR